ncbi:hypothetical protein AXG93_1860s1000 [Marchantia polymorpha subsp. ruderalis]|uniref:Chalcone/stilbene synthase C-terminal domain-containing protein n=1 Tax=Marchantia polymorpha subsp. ruderalis TaxID=1480154 RepID=A0A176VG50_MARPO|nr:hypothetical protein AXG93_1860s1000 [Marchantia polymorpha subsp. ruderalis]
MQVPIRARVSSVRTLRVKARSGHSTPILRGRLAIGSIEEYTEGDMARPSKSRSIKVDTAQGARYGIAEVSLRVAKTLSLKPEKMEATRDVLYNYGNMSGASVLFVLDQMRRRSAEKKSSTTGEGCEWGLVVGFGPGLTIEVSVLKAIATGN